LLATIVHNAGIYNGIVAGGLFWAAFRGDPAVELDLSRPKRCGIYYTSSTPSRKQQVSK
jgi:hypothetical protein